MCAVFQSDSSAYDETLEPTLNCRKRHVPEIQHGEGRVLTARVATVGIFFDTLPGLPALTPIIAAHVESTLDVADRTTFTVPAGSEEKMNFVPLSNTRNADKSSRTELHHTGVVFSSFVDDELYNIMRGIDGCGGLSAFTRSIGTNMSADQVVQTTCISRSHHIDTSSKIPRLPRWMLLPIRTLAS